MFVCYSFWSDTPIYRQGLEVVGQTHMEQNLEHNLKISLTGSSIQILNGQKSDSIWLLDWWILAQAGFAISTDGMHSFPPHRKQAVSYQPMEFFNSYQTGFPPGPFLSCLSWIGRAETTLLYHPLNLPWCAFMCWLFLLFVSEETSMPYKHVLWLTWNSWRYFSWFVIELKYMENLDKEFRSFGGWKDAGKEGGEESRTLL